MIEMNLASMTGESLDENSPHLGPFDRRTAGYGLRSCRPLFVDAPLGAARGRAEVIGPHRSQYRIADFAGVAVRFSPAHPHDGPPFRDAGPDLFCSSFGLGRSGAAFWNERALNGVFACVMFSSLSVSIIPPQ